MTFVFDSCRRSSAAVAPVEYKCDSNTLWGTFGRSKIFVYGEINERNFSDPHSRTCTVGIPIRGRMSDDDVIKCKHFPRYWPFVRGIYWSPVNCPHKGQWSGALMFSLICVWINGWVNNREAGGLRRYRAHYDVSVMLNVFHVRVHVVLLTRKLEFYTIGEELCCTCLIAVWYIHYSNVSFLTGYWTDTLLGN